MIRYGLVEQWHEPQSSIASSFTIRPIPSARLCPALRRNRLGAQNLDGVFWQNELGFVVDKHKMPSSFPSGDIFGPVSLRALLLDSKKLPNLGAAPVASWLLARLMQLTNEGLGFERNDRLYNDGGGYYLNFITFSRNMTPLAFFNVHGTSEECSCWGNVPLAFYRRNYLRPLLTRLS